MNQDEQIKISSVIFTPESFGITQESLQVLRDSLAERIYHRIVVFEIPTNNLSCGYLILDADDGVAVFTGDGFRIDQEGEGGAGYRTARAIFDVYGIMAMTWNNTENFDEIYEENGKEKICKKLLALSQNIADQIEPSLFRRIKENKPYYLRRSP